MNKEILKSSIFWGLCLSGVMAMAQAPTSTPILYQAKEVDLAAGERLAKEGNKNGATACFACHGMKGGENLTGAFPRIANQPALYLSSQLKDYASGARSHPVMEAIAKGLTDEERENVSAYYASLGMDLKKIPQKTKGDIKRGEILAKIGDAKIRVQACNNCHGPGGIGLAPSIPYIAGQFGSYIEAQLKQWKEGARKNSPGQMGDIAKRLSDEDRAALAAYFEQAPIPKVSQK